MKVQSKLKILFLIILCSLGSVCFNVQALSRWSVPYSNLSQDWSQVPTRNVESNVMWHTQAPSLYDHMKSHVSFHVDSKHASSFSRSQQNNLWLEIKRCAHYLVNHDPDVSATYQHIRHELSSMLLTIQKGTTHEQLIVIDRLQELKGSFDQYEQALQTKFNQVERSLHTAEQLKVISCSMDITRYLKHELHNVLDSIKVGLSRRDGTFLGTVQHTVVQFLKKCLGFWTLESIIQVYVHQYTNGGALVDMPVPDQICLEQIDQNRFNQDIKQLNRCLKQADTVGARHIVEVYAGNKQAYQLMKSFVDSSPYPKQHGQMLNEARQLLNDKAVIAGDTPYYQLREQALQQVAQGDLLVQHKQYSLSSETAQVFKQAGYDPVQFKSCTGNLVQQDTHAKLVNSLNQLAQKPVRTQSAQQMKDGVLDCAQAGNALNQAGSLKEAMVLSDLCHVAVEYLLHGIDTGIAISKGVAEGVYVGVSSEIAQAFHEGAKESAYQTSWWKSSTGKG